MTCPQHIAECTRDYVHLHQGRGRPVLREEKPGTDIFVPESRVGAKRGDKISHIVPAESPLTPECDRYLSATPSEICVALARFGIHAVPEHDGVRLYLAESRELVGLLEDFFSQANDPVHPEGGERAQD